MPSLNLNIIPRAPFEPYLRRLQRWACLVVHRRGGKTFCCVQDLIHRALTHKREGMESAPLRYGYIAPTRDQARDVTWMYLTNFCSQIPRTEINKAELTITFHNKATIRLYSGENYERMRGIYFDGVVIDEMADIDPQAWEAVILPCLTDYDGWATFIGTPKGRNKFWEIYRDSVDDPEWFSLLLRASESGILTEEQLAVVKKTQNNPELYKQEYECDFSVGRPGAIYASDIEQAHKEKRINDDVLWYKELPVYTSFDVGAPLNQKVWIWQMVGSRLNYLESLSGDFECKTPADWAARLRLKKYSYGAHFIPHDAAMEQGGLWQGGLDDAGLSHVVPVPKQFSVWDGIALALDAFPRSHFNKSGCSDGIEALDAFHSKEDRDGKTIGKIPVHDWASHYSDAFSLSHQAIKHGLVIDRTAIARKPRTSFTAQVIAGPGGSNRSTVVRR